MNKTNKKILKVAVTGGAGSGKTSVCNRLKELGVKVISADEMAREAVAPGSTAFKKIVHYFGNTILLSDGTLNRKKLRRMITDDSDARLAMERFIHHEIAKLILKNVVFAEKEGSRMVVIEVPLLFELDMKEKFDWVVVVSADKELRVKRLMERDQTSRDEATHLIDVQMPEKEKINRADYVVRNEGSMEKLVESVDILFNNLNNIIK
ncbi:MAG TPA: dephospho-CoA kinase [Desulfobacterales bacterium]|nr:dephospho-CoA kinase [Desulfobacterales bacterium]